MKKIYNWFASLWIVKKIRQVKLFDRLLSYEVLTYLFFGVMTTVVNLAIFYLSDKILGNAHIFDVTLFGHPFSVTLEEVSTVIAWVGAVLFAFFTNKFLVFESRDRHARAVLRELLRFIGARILSFVLFESFGFWLVRNLLINMGLQETWAKWVGKLLTSILVVIFNYVASKFVVFRRGKDANSVEEE